MKPEKFGRGEFSISSDYLISLSEQAFERGMTVAELLEGTGLAAEILLAQDVSLGHESFLQAIDNFRCHDGNFWTAIEGGRRMTLSKHGYVGYAAQNSRTLAEAAEKLYRYVATRTDLFILCPGSHSERAELHLQPRIQQHPSLSYVCLSLLVCLETLCRQILQRQARNIPSTIFLPAPPPPTPAPPLPAGSRIVFNADHYSLSWPLTIRDLSLPDRNEGLSKIADAHCESNLKQVYARQSIQDRVRQQLLRSEGYPQLEDIAARLNMSAASLKRRLREEGSSYLQIKDELRRQQACELLLHSQNSIDSIAEQLGYSDASNFSKAFRGWTGQTPGQYRQENKAH